MFDKNFIQPLCFLSLGLSLLSIVIHLTSLSSSYKKKEAIYMIESPEIYKGKIVDSLVVKDNGYSFRIIKSNEKIQGIGDFSYSLVKEKSESSRHSLSF